MTSLFPGSVITEGEVGNHTETNVADSGDRGIIRVFETDPFSLSSHSFHNSSDALFDRSKHVQPIPGYDDVFIHGDAWGVATKDADGNDIDIPNTEFVNTLKQLSFENQAIRLCACDAGAFDNGIASYVARELNMPVMAATTHVWISAPDKNGVSNMVLYAEDADKWVDYSKPGKWRIFYPNGRIEEVTK